MQINIEKRHFLIILGMMCLLAGGVVYAYGTSSASTLGHTGGEIAYTNCEWKTFTVNFGIVPDDSSIYKDYMCPPGKVVLGTRFFYRDWTGGNAPDGTYLAALYCCS